MVLGSKAFTRAFLAWQALGFKVQGEADTGTIFSHDLPCPPQPCPGIIELSWSLVASSIVVPQPPPGNIELSTCPDAHGTGAAAC